MSKPLTIAVNKGRILEQLLPLLETAGIQSKEDPRSSRKLLFASVCEQYRIVVMRGADIPVYVEQGAADIGITGKDTLLEYPGYDYYERLDLGIARCRVMTAAPVGYIRPRGRPLRVATKFTSIAQKYYAEQGVQVKLIKLAGAMEIAPLMGLADQIVDIVDTGNTLKANGLEARELICEVSTRVIVNRASLKLRLDEIEALIQKMRVARG